MQGSKHGDRGDILRVQITNSALDHGGHMGNIFLWIRGLWKPKVSNFGEPILCQQNVISLHITMKYSRTAAHMQILQTCPSTAWFWRMWNVINEEFRKFVNIILWSRSEKQVITSLCAWQQQQSGLGNVVNESNTNEKYTGIAPVMILLLVKSLRNVPYVSNIKDVMS